MVKQIIEIIIKEAEKQAQKKNSLDVASELWSIKQDIDRKIQEEIQKLAAQL